MKDLAKKFFALFAGLPRAYGRYELGDPVSNGAKQSGRAETVRGAVTLEHWLKHLAGEIGLGIIPIRDDGTVRFGVIDIDINTIDHAALEQAINRLGFPLIVCRSKSGGAHLYLFLKEDTSAKLVRDKLTLFAAALGHSGVEIFPKQIMLASTNDVGNWINIPYFGGDRSTRYAIKNGSPLTMEQFIEYAEEKSVEAAALEETNIDSDEMFEEGPPCLQTLALTGVSEGVRNKGLYNFGVLIKKKYPEEIAERLKAVNEAYFDPPLPSGEVSTIVQSLGRKDYFYTCKEEPICSHCDKVVCKTREYGIGSGGHDLVLGTFTKVLTNPPSYFFDVEGFRVEMYMDDLISQQRFRKKVAERIDKILPLMKSDRWERLINERLANAEMEEAPKDASADGQFMLLLEQFCGRHQGRNKEDLLRGKPWQEEEKVYFRSNDLMLFLDRAHFKSFNERQIWGLLRDMGGHKQFHVKGRCVQAWWVPAFEEQTEDFSVPTIDATEEF